MALVAGSNPAHDLIGMQGCDIANHCVSTVLLARVFRYDSFHEKKKIAVISTIAAGTFLLGACSSDSSSSGDLSQEFKDQYVQSEVAVTAVEEAVIAAATSQPTDFATIVDDWETFQADITAYEQTLDDLIAAALDANNDSCKDALLRYQVLELVDSEILDSIYESAKEQNADDTATHAYGLNTMMNSTLSETLDKGIESNCGLSL